MTAQEARVITDSRKKDIASVLMGIKVMAESGKDFFCIKTDEVLNPDEQAAYFEGLGYKVGVSVYFKITW